MDRDDDERIESTCIILCKNVDRIPEIKCVMANLFAKVIGKGFSGAPWFCVFFRGRGVDTKICWKFNTTKVEWVQLKKAIEDEFGNNRDWIGLLLSRGKLTT